MKIRVGKIGPPLIAGAALLLVWYAIKRIWEVPTLVLPAPDEIARAGWRNRRDLAEAAAFTAEGALLGFLAAAVGGFLLAAAISASVMLRRALMPYVLVFQMTPVVILAPMYVLWLGQGLPAITAITFMICFFPVVANTTTGLCSVDRNLSDLFVVAGASRVDELFRLRVPSALPYFLTGLRIAGTLAPIGAITGDMLAGSAQNSVGGLGFMTVVYFSQLKTPDLLAVALTASLLGFLFVGGVNLTSWWALHRWHESAAAE